MDKVKGVAKGGWHPPGKDGGKESWRKDFKGTLSVLVREISGLTRWYRHWSSGSSCKLVKLVSTLKC